MYKFILCQFGYIGINRPGYNEDVSESMQSINVGEWGYINKTGDVVIEPQIERAYPFNDGIAMVQIDEKIGLIKKRELLWNLSTLIEYVQVIYARS